MNTHQNAAARFLAIAFSIVLLAISATTSFAFFVEFFPQIIPASILSPVMSGLISGAIGVALFDLATVIWLLLYLHDAQTPQQRAVALVLTAATFIGSAAASVAYLSLSATGDMAVLDEATKTTVASFALVTVLLGIVGNFGGSQMYTRYSHDNILAVNESNRRDTLLAAEFEQAKHLDSLISQQVKEQLTAIAPALAQQQAARLVDAFYRQETAKYANGGALPAPAQETAVSQDANEADPYGEMGQYIWHADDNGRPTPTRQPSTNGHQSHGRGA